MNKNNYMFTLFRDLKQGYANDNIGQIEQCARCWMQLDPENPFEYDTPEYEEFFQMKRSYTIWARGDVDRKINRRHMIAHAKALCALNPRQPYTFDKKAEAEEKRIEDEKRKAELLERQEKELLEQKKLDELRIVEANPKKKIVLTEPEKILNVQEETKEEKKGWLKIFQFWR